MKPPASQDPYASKRATYALVWYITGTVVGLVITSTLIILSGPDFKTRPQVSFFGMTAILVLWFSFWSIIWLPLSQTYPSLTFSDFYSRTVIGYHQVIDMPNPGGARSRVEPRDERQDNASTFALYVKLGGWWPRQKAKVRVGRFTGLSPYRREWRDEHQLTIVPTSPEAHSFRITDTNGDRWTVTAGKLLWHIHNTFKLDPPVILAEVLRDVEDDLRRTQEARNELVYQFNRLRSERQQLFVDLTCEIQLNQAYQKHWEVVRESLDECIKITNRCFQFTSLHLAQRKLGILGRLLNTIYNRAIGGRLNQIEKTS